MRPPEVRRLLAEGMRRWWAANPEAREAARRRMLALWDLRRCEARALGVDQRGIEKIR